MSLPLCAVAPTVGEDQAFAAGGVFWESCPWPGPGSGGQQSLLPICLPSGRGLEGRLCSETW